MPKPGKERSRMKIAGCLGCEYCHTKGEGKCLQKDDMDKVMPAYLESGPASFLRLRGNRRRRGHDLQGSDGLHGHRGLRRMLAVRRGQ